VEVATQVGARVRFRLVGPERERHRVAGEVRGAVQQQEREQRHGARSTAKRKRLSANTEARLPEEGDAEPRCRGRIPEYQSATLHVQECVNFGRYDG
jgi:hypothetical protein